MSRRTILISVVACLSWGPFALMGKAHAATQVTINNTRIDRNFIRMMEGSSLKGYVPLVATTQSGVTIAHGFDLGQLSIREFNNLPFDGILRGKLRPYVGVKKYAALSLLKRYPLTITNNELQEINLIAANKILQPLVKYYNESSRKSFLALPGVAQTVVFSMAYQNGPAFKRQPQMQKLWYYFVTQNWAQASIQLRKLPTYKSRRNSEAALLMQLT